MPKLIYASNMSLDGFTEDKPGGFNWTKPDDDVFMAITELMASAGTYLYGRRMYEVLAPWETDSSLGMHSKLHAEYARVWQSADKIVYSSTLPSPITANTRIERHFDPEAVRDLKISADSDLLVGGPTLAAQAMAAGLVDEVVLWVWPIILNGCKPALSVEHRVDLELIDERRFDSGVVELRYAVR